MKEISLEKQIYLCKYHRLDKLDLSTEDVEEILEDLRKRGLYEKYKNMSEEEYEKKIMEEKKNPSIKENKEEQRNDLMSLNNILFEQLRKLNSDNLSQKELEMELSISKQVVNVSQTIINNANLLLQAKKHFDITGEKTSEVAPILRIDK